MDDRYRFDRQNPPNGPSGIGCAGQLYYADANPSHTGCSNYGFEFDLFEGNVASTHTTAHGCISGLSVPGSTVKTGMPRYTADGKTPPGASGWYGAVDRSVYPDPDLDQKRNRVCDSYGTGVGTTGTGVTPYPEQSYGWGDEYTINTMRPFRFSVRFDHGDGDSPWSFTTRMEQEGRSVGQTMTRADADTRTHLFPTVGTYQVRFESQNSQEWLVVDSVYIQQREASGFGGVHTLEFEADGTSVKVRRAIALGDDIEMAGRRFSNNVTDATAMPTFRKKEAWDEMGRALGEKGLSMVLAYWAQPATTTYGTMGAWDALWLNGKCAEQGRQPTPDGEAYPVRMGMGSGCLSDIRIEKNAESSRLVLGVTSGTRANAQLSGGEKEGSIGHAETQYKSMVAERSASTYTNLAIVACLIYVCYVVRKRIMRKQRLFGYQLDTYWSALEQRVKPMQLKLMAYWEEARAQVERAEAEKQHLQELEAAPAEISDALPTEISDALPTEFSDALPTEISDALPTQISDALPTEISDALQTEISDALPTQISDALPTEISDALQTEISDALPTQISDALQTEISDALPTETSDALPTEISDRTSPEVSPSEAERIALFVAEGENHIRI